MAQQIVLGWRAMRLVSCLACGDWGLAGTYGAQHVAGRVAPRAVCLGRGAWLKEPAPKRLPPEHRRPWWWNVPQDIVLEEGRRPISPEPHSRAWDYLPPAPAPGCTCGYHLAWSWRTAREVPPGRGEALLLYCQALGPAIVYEGGVRVEAFRILAYVQLPSPGWRWSLVAPEVAEVMATRWGPEISDPSSLPTGAFDRVPPEAAALM